MLNLELVLMATAMGPMTSTAACMLLSFLVTEKNADTLVTVCDFLNLQSPTRPL